MTQLSHDEFLGYVKEWIVKNESEIAKMWPQKGGWEGWAQSSILSFIVGKNSTYDILREQHVYTSSGKEADFLLNNNSPAKERVVVELKCQSLENFKNFKSGLEDDIAKLIKELKPAYTGAALLVIGIYFQDHADIPKYFNNKDFDKGEVGICWALDLNS